MNIIKKLIYKIRGEYTTEQLIERGMTVGTNFQRQNEVILDPDHCWLIEIGNNVTLAPRVYVLCHDASTKRWLGVTKIGRVTIGNDVFIGANSLIMPGVTIGNGVIIGANSIVTQDIPDHTVAVGNPARAICTLDEYLDKERKRMKQVPCYGEEYTLRKNVTINLCKKQKTELTETIGYID
ncbi:acyltransferase [Fusicatenibacter saccharivorans]|uniref:acyltransferase n=1 Tax=Fusicatenibacter saccharivorans TaxID=1150298 RepID=UPI003F8E656C